MNTEEVILHLRDFLIARLLLERGAVASIRDEDDLTEKGLIDSFGILELVHHLEERYSFTVLDEEITLENLSSLQAIAKFVMRKSHDSPL